MNTTRKISIVDEFLRDARERGVGESIVGESRMCVVCHQENRLFYDVKPEIRKAVVPEIFSDGRVCLTCFDQLAHKRGIPIADAIKNLRFDGRAVSFSMHIKRGADKGAKRRGTNSDTARKNTSRHRNRHHGNR